ncbi:RHS repeat domain-containing protein [Longispora albida]|uniref:RHS repeat domain-containing protein n=1 Tax=Longispora albida TaxID=203523 RepID=UPI0003AB16EA|nr:RHS repeat-associated core domain-containing protein [Longispora albida]
MLRSRTAPAAATLGIVLAVSLTASPALGAPLEDLGAPALRKDRSVPVIALKAQAPGEDPASKKAIKTTPAVTWPRAGAAEADLGAASAQPAGPVQPRVKAGDLPVSVSLAAGTQGLTGDAAGSSGRRVRVEVLDRQQAGKAGRSGLLLRLSETGAQRGGKAAVELDYSGFRNAYGADWASRLTFIALPECALTTPEAPACQGTPVAARNDIQAGKLTADLTTAPPSGATGIAAQQGGMLYAAAAGSQGSSGSFAATSLAPSATWKAGGMSGDFTWSYPLRTPPAAGGLAPSVGLSYNSGSVDGRTAATNSQPSWAGEGFEYWPGYIERKYKPCGTDQAAENGQAPSNASRKTGDLCWATDNATLYLNGSAVELVQGDDGVWRPRNDDGSRIERLTDTSLANGDDNGEYWRVTTRDGTQYHFGLNKLPGWTAGKPLTQSVLTVPVYGNHPGEPCYNATFASGWCQQAWRWNLDHVTDRHDNSMAMYYTPEANKYGRDLTTSNATAYQRGATLDRIEYGHRKGSEHTTTAPARITFTPAERCIPGSVCDFQHPENMPDTPVDQNCDAASCTQTSPTFWTTKRLAKITTQVAAAGGGYRDVDSWTLTHSFPSPGDGTRAGLWLEKISHTGHVGGSITLPDVTFTGTQLSNRVVTDSAYPTMNWWRITSMRSEAGGVLTVSYTGQDCTPTSLPSSPDGNTRRCMPVRWTPDGGAERLDWFHKYLVTRVDESQDNITGVQHVVSEYEYIGTPAWRFDDADGLTPADKKTWSQWRGYAKVAVRKGAANDDGQTYTESVFYRGMHGDKLAAGGTKTATVTDSDGGTVDDLPQYSGTVREQTTYNGPGGAVLSRVISTPVATATGTRTRSWGTTSSYRSDNAVTLTKTPLSGGQTRRVRSETTFDSVRGLPLLVNDIGDESTTADDKCVRYTYTAENTSRWLIGMPSIVETTAGICSTPRTTGDVLASKRAYYDTQALGAAPVSGDITKAEELASTGVWVLASQSTYDVHGRVITLKNARGETTTTAYTPVTGGPVTKQVVTNPLGHASTTEYEPAWGATVTTVDANSRRTDMAYDALGRLVQGWAPGRDKATQTASVQFEYVVAKNAPNVVTTKKLRNDGGYHTAYALYDGLMRIRQTQAPATGSQEGRVITDTFYNTRGLTVKTNGQYFNAAAPGTTVVAANDVDVPDQNVTVYDGASRPTASIFKVQNIEKWRTTTAYDGERTHITPPQGGTATTSIVNAQGNQAELWQYKAATPAGAHDTTVYGYDRAGRMTSVTDTLGNKWGFEYDLLGRKTRTTDPDKGDAFFTYTPAGDVATTKDARGFTIAYVYDRLGRKTESRKDTITGQLYAEWKYDTLAKGMLTSATRWENGSAYITATTGYDPMYRPSGYSVTIPAAEGNLAGTYTSGITYNTDGSIATTSMPAAGGLQAETLTYGYDGFAQAAKLTGTLAENTTVTYASASYYNSLGDLTQYVLGASGKRLWQVYDYELGTRRLSNSYTKREKTGAVQADTYYTWDPAGNLTKIKDTPTNPVTGQPNAPYDAQCFAYDYLRRMTEAWTPADINSSCATVPATMNTSTIGGPAPYWQSWTYDAAGNRTKQTDHANGDTNTTHTYTYPAPGPSAVRPHAVTSIAHAGPAGNSTDTFGYGLTGNTTTRTQQGQTQTLTWAPEGQLKTLTAAGKTSTMIYNADGERLLRKDATSTTLYLGVTELRLDTTVTSASPVATRYYTHAGRIIAVRTVTGLTWLTADHHGTGRLAFNATDLELLRRRELPFGASRGTTVTGWPGERGFVGGVQNPSGLITLGAREYDPATGKFMSVDPVIDVGDPQQMNGYSYANNSPASTSDPDGRRAYTDDPEMDIPAADDEAGDEKWYKKFGDAHETAISLRIIDIYMRWNRASRGEETILIPPDVTRDRTRNRIIGGSAKGNGEDGYADIICWNCDPGVIYVWEIKHFGGEAEKSAPAQLKRYIANLQLQIANDPEHKDKIVMAGPAFDNPSSGPRALKPDETVTVWSSAEPGVEVYRIDKNQGTAKPAPTPTATATPTTIPHPGVRNTTKPETPKTPQVSRGVQQDDAPDLQDLRVPAPVKNGAMVTGAVLCLPVIVLGVGIVWLAGA